MAELFLIGSYKVDLILKQILSFLQRNAFLDCSPYSGTKLKLFLNQIISCLLLLAALFQPRFDNLKLGYSIILSSKIETSQSHTFHVSFWYLYNASLRGCAVNLLERCSSFCVGFKLFSLKLQCNQSSRMSILNPHPLTSVKYIQNLDAIRHCKDWHLIF